VGDGLGPDLVPDPPVPADGNYGRGHVPNMRWSLVQRRGGKYGANYFTWAEKRGVHRRKGKKGGDGKQSRDSLSEEHNGGKASSLSFFSSGSERPEQAGEDREINRIEKELDEGKNSNKNTFGDSPGGSSEQTLSQLWDRGTSDAGPRVVRYLGEKEGSSDPAY